MGGKGSLCRMDEDFTFGNIEVKKKWLFLPSGERVKLSEIASTNIVWKPRRKIIRGVIIWFAIIFLFEVFRLHNYGFLLLVGFLILILGPVMLYDSIKYNLKEAKTALCLELSSGRHLYLHNDSYSFLEELEEVLWQSITSLNDTYTINLNNYGTINIAKNIKNEEGKEEKE